MFNFEFEDQLTEGSIIWRYVSADTFLRMLESSSIYLPTAANYEDTDLNEGRFTERYVNVVRNWVRHNGPTDITEEEEVKIEISYLLAAREASYISCWTYRENEDEQMWNSFGDSKRGIAIKTTLGKVWDEFEEYCDNNVPYDLVIGLIEYDRINMHRHIHSENIHNYHLPLFFLDGGEESFKNEQECRLILYDPMEVTDISSNLLTEGLVRSQGSLVLTESSRVRFSRQQSRGLATPVNLENFLLEIRFGSEMEESTRASIVEKLEIAQIAHLCRESVF